MSLVMTFEMVLPKNRFALYIKLINCSCIGNIDINKSFDSDYSYHDIRVKTIFVLRKLKSDDNYNNQFNNVGKNENDKYNELVYNHKKCSNIKKSDIDDNNL